MSVRRLAITGKPLFLQISMNVWPSLAMLMQIAPIAMVRMNAPAMWATKATAQVVQVNYWKTY